jgi:hypothetical protein
MILLRDLKGAVRLGRSKDVSVHVSTCTSYNFKALTQVMWKLWCVFLCLIPKVGDRFLEIRINIKFCLKIRKESM